MTGDYGTTRAAITARGIFTLAILLAVVAVAAILGTVAGYSALARYEMRENAAVQRDIQEKQAVLDLRIALSQTEGCFEPPASTS